jgi:hypothetical protein
MTGTRPGGWLWLQACAGRVESFDRQNPQSAPLHRPACCKQTASFESGSPVRCTQNSPPVRGDKAKLLSDLPMRRVQLPIGERNPQQTAIRKHQS